MIKETFDISDQLARMLFASGLAHLITLLLISILLFVAAGSICYLVASRIFSWLYFISTGQEFVLTVPLAKRIAYVFAWILAAFCIYSVAQSLITGETMERIGRSGSHTIFWRDGHLEFIWAIIENCLSAAIFWGCIRQGLVFFAKTPDKKK